MIDIECICKDVLCLLTEMDYEYVQERTNLKKTSGQLIFPKKSGAVDRISEQELRQIFIDVFKEKYPNLYYSVETPTVYKYKFGNELKDIEGEIKEDFKGQSALHDMTIFEKINNEYNRILNIEFKYGNAPLKSFGKDILKLINEEQNGLFVILLKNYDGGTFNNNSKTGVFDKLNESIIKFRTYWKNEEKSIHIVTLTLEKKNIRCCVIKKNDLNDEKTINFCIDILKVFDKHNINGHIEWKK